MITDLNSANISIDYKVRKGNDDCLPVILSIYPLWIYTNPVWIQIKNYRLCKYIYLTNLLLFCLIYIHNFVYTSRITILERTSSRLTFELNLMFE